MSAAPEQSSRAPLGEQSLDGRLRTLARERPVAAVLGAFLIGFAAARLLIRR
jgi:hypothetical protein